MGSCVTAVQSTSKVNPTTSVAVTPNSHFPDADPTPGFNHALRPIPKGCTALTDNHHSHEEAEENTESPVQPLQRERWGIRQGGIALALLLSHPKPLRRVPASRTQGAVAQGHTPPVHGCLG